MKKSMVSLLTAAALTATSLWATQPKPEQPINPFEEIQKVQQEMARIFRQLHQRLMQDADFAKFHTQFAASPAVDLKDDGDHYTLKADIPGADEKSIDVTVKNGMLTIKAQTVREEKEKGENYLRQERYVGSFVRALSLPSDADTKEMKTAYKNGVLTVTIPKKK